MSTPTGPAVTKVNPVITGELKSKIDRVWDSFWSGGIGNPLEVIEQIIYLLFIRRLDDIQTLAEKKARVALTQGTSSGVGETFFKAAPDKPRARCQAPRRALHV